MARFIAVLRHIGPAQRLPKPALLAKIARADHHQAIGGLVAAIGRIFMVIAARARGLAAAPVGSDMACHHHHRNIHHGEINMLASPGFFALEQGR